MIFLKKRLFFIYVTLNWKRLKRYSGPILKIWGTKYMVENEIKNVIFEFFQISSFSQYLKGFENSFFSRLFGAFLALFESDQAILRMK